MGNSKYWDRQVLANSVDPDQTAPKEQSDRGLCFMPFHLHFLDTLMQLQTRAPDKLGFCGYLEIHVNYSYFATKTYAVTPN